MEISYKPIGVCAKNIIMNVEDDVITNVKFVGGCPGNLLGVSTLVKGMTVAEAIEKLEGIRCGAKDTSCPDQLAKALQTL